MMTEGVLQKFINKIFGLYIHIRYRNVPYDLRFFIRDTYNCNLRQWKYIIKDYVTRKKYKTISFNGEFGAELLFVLPFAYWHYKNGTLKSTVASKYTSELYFFSPDHKEVFDKRVTIGNYNYETPRILYSHNYNMKKWLPVPYKEVYKNDVFVYEKPILIVANRYNMEWDGPPISFFSIEMLAFIFDNLKSDYTIIYNRPRPQNITLDNSAIYDLNEFEWIRKHYPEVILMEDLYQENEANVRSFNHLQLMVYANCENFISTHGGTGTLTSCFGGLNIILSKQGAEHYFKCFEILFPKLSGARIFHAKNDEELKKMITENLVTKRASINALDNKTITA